MVNSVEAIYKGYRPAVSWEKICPMWTFFRHGRGWFFRCVQRTSELFVV